MNGRMILCFLLSFTLILTTHFAAQATAQGTEVSLSLSAHPSLGNVGESIRVDGGVEPRLNGTITLMPYTGKGTPQIIRDITVESGEISFDWIPSNHGKYMLVVIFTPEDSSYRTSIGIIKDVIVKDIRNLLKEKESMI